MDADALTEMSFLDPDDESDAAPEPEALPLARAADDPVPALREVRARIVQLTDDGRTTRETDSDEGQSVVLLEDPEGHAPQSAALSTWAYALAMLFDGRRTVMEIAQEFENKYNQPIEADQILELQRELDTAMFLWSRRFERNLKSRIKNYLDANVRPPALAGSAYPDDTQALQLTVESFFDMPGGPGGLDSLHANDIARANDVKAVIVPTIDLRVGGATYAHGYKKLIQDSKADLFIILGISHQSFGSTLYQVSQKDYATPYGVLKTNRAIAERLQAASDTEVDLAELAHRTDPSIEFQSVMLQALLGERYKRPIEIVPVLCASIELFLSTDQSPFNNPVFNSFTAALHNELASSSRKVCVICSADFSRVGPEFGHSTMMTEKLRLPIERADRKLIKLIEGLDQKKIYGEITRTQNSRHIDSILPILTMLAACEGMLQKGELLHYDQLLKEGSHSVVSFASIAFV